MLQEGAAGAQYGLNASVVRAANEFLIIGAESIFKRPSSGLTDLLRMLGTLTADLDPTYRAQIEESSKLIDGMEESMRGSIASIQNPTNASPSSVIEKYRKNIISLNSGSILNNPHRRETDMSGNAADVKKVVLFRGYTAEGTNLSITANTGGSGGVALPFGALTNTLFNIAPILDTTRRAQYTGPQPVSYSVNVHLFLRNDFQKDIMEPLLLLLALALPFRVSTNLSLLFDALVLKVADKLTSLFPVIGQALEMAKEFLALDEEVYQHPITTFLGESYVIAPPPPYSMFKQNTIGELTAFIGGFKLSNIVIEQINIKVPPMLVEGGLPDRLAIALTLKSLRLPTFDYMKDIFSGLVKEANVQSASRP